MSNTDKIVATLVSVIPDIVGLFLFIGSAYFSYFIFIWTKSPFLQLFFLAVLLSIALIRLLTISSRLIFSPSSSQFRILPLTCQQASSFHTFIVATGGYFVSVLMFATVIFKLGASRNTVSLLGIIFVSLLLIVTAVAVLKYRERMKMVILQSTESIPTWGRTKFASLWHILALLYLCILWLLLVNSIDSPSETNSRGAFIVSFFVLPVWIIVDRFVQWIVKFSMKTLNVFDEFSQQEDMSEEDQLRWNQGKTWYNRNKLVSRIFLIVILIIWIASLWGIQLPFITNITTVFFDASIILTLSLVLWQFVSTWIERKIEESTPEDDDSETGDDEWGSAAARGRAYTLLPMIRKFIGSVLVIMVTMTILSSMGVDIGPLLAGAGVVGLAIGFGAQKLVADMFSGFFYLLDDAFRVGEYVEAGSVSGTVENISLRNVMLRHHRGMLQIVPHSELGAITNFMRGGIVVKFSLDFPYDADIDQIRKVIKKVGQAMLKDEEFGKDFIKPVKSQGVREITNSVMTIRVKFTAQPGAHFVIRREAYKRITEALNEKQLYYAHKKVIVDVPQTGVDSLSGEQLKAAGAAAAALQIDKPDGLKPEDL